MTRRAYFMLLAFALLGLGASSTSAWVHYRLLNDPTYTSFCDVNATVSCTEAYTSVYGSFMGTPVAILGALWFLGVVVLLIAGRPGAGRLSGHVGGYVFALSVVALPIIVFLAYSSFFVLKAVCLLCVTTYVAVIGLFGVSGSQSKFSMASLPQRLARDLQTAASNPMALSVLVMFFVGAASAIAFFPKEASAGGGGGAAAAAGVAQSQATEVEQWFDSQPRNIIPVGDTGGAQVVIVKFNDYQCPACKQTYLGYKPILEKYATQAPGKVLMVTKHFPLDPECNVNTPQANHYLSCEAAAAVVLADKSVKPKLEDWIFTNAAMLNGDQVKQAAKTVGNITDYELNYSKALEQIKADIALGKLLGVNATPTFFINGVKVSGGLQPQFLDVIIAHELAKGQTQK
ncbi:MAG: vitamin K epoxide reductase family protein [Vicinamibacterales bacterium]